MKTAMRELIKYMNDYKECDGNRLSIIAKAKKLLIKEKEQTVNAFVDGKLHGIDCGKMKADKFITGQDYFNQTFK